MSRFQIIELSTERTPADDRPLLKRGEFGTGSFGQSEIAEFPSQGAAYAAAEQATNRRPNTSLWVCGSSKVAA